MGMSPEETRWRMETGAYTAKWPGFDPRYKTPSVKPTIDEAISGIPRPELVMDGDPGVMGGGNVPPSIGGQRTGGSWGKLVGDIDVRPTQYKPEDRKMPKSGIDTGSTMPVSDLKSRKWLILGFIAVIGFLAFGAMKR